MLIMSVLVLGCELKANCILSAEYSLSWRMENPEERIILIMCFNVCSYGAYVIHIIKIWWLMAKKLWRFSCMQYIRKLLLGKINFSSVFFFVCVFSGHNSLCSGLIPGLGITPGRDQGTICGAVGCQRTSYMKSYPWTISLALQQSLWSQLYLFISCLQPHRTFKKKSLLVKNKLSGAG